MNDLDKWKINQKDILRILCDTSNHMECSVYVSTTHGVLSAPFFPIFTHLDIYIYILSLFLSISSYAYGLYIGPCDLGVDIHTFTFSGHSHIHI